MATCSKELVLVTCNGIWSDVKIHFVSSWSHAVMSHERCRHDSSFHWHRFNGANIPIRKVAYKTDRFNFRLINIFMYIFTTLSNLTIVKTVFFIILNEFDKLSN